MGLPVDSFLVIPEDSVDVSLPPPPDTASGLRGRGRAARRGLRLREQRRGRLPAVRAHRVRAGRPRRGRWPLPDRGRGLHALRLRTAARSLERSRQRTAPTPRSRSRGQARLAVEQSARTRVSFRDSSRIARRWPRPRSPPLPHRLWRARIRCRASSGQRSARDAVRQYLEDLAALETAAATVALARIAGLLPDRCPRGEREARLDPDHRPE
jgi:hypothetical protein